MTTNQPTNREELVELMGRSLAWHDYGEDLWNLLPPSARHKWRSKALTYWRSIAASHKER